MVLSSISLILLTSVVPYLKPFPRSIPYMFTITGYNGEPINKPFSCWYISVSR